VRRNARAQSAREECKSTKCTGGMGAKLEARVQFWVCSPALSRFHLELFALLLRHELANILAKNNHCLLLVVRDRDLVVRIQVQIVNTDETSQY
jgi:hypothetical protein